jgi:cytoskeletal protein CcmA (bactofilin family)
MWNRRKEEDYSPRPTPTASQPPAEPRRDAGAVSGYAGRSMDVESLRGAAVIGKSVVIKGEIHSREDLTIDGEVEGIVEAQENRITIGSNGRLRAKVKGREIVVLGNIQGDVEASDKIDIRKDAKLVGDIKTARIVIEDGAYFKGSIDITRTEVAKPAPAPAKSIPAAASAGPVINPGPQGGAEPRR